jgi:hypothetical protein
MAAFCVTVSHLGLLFIVCSNLISNLIRKTKPLRLIIHSVPHKNPKLAKAPGSARWSHLININLFFSEFLKRENLHYSSILVGFAVVETILARARIFNRRINYANHKTTHIHFMCPSRGMKWNEKRKKYVEFFWTASDYLLHCVAYSFYFYIRNWMFICLSSPLLNLGKLSKLTWTNINFSLFLLLWLELFKLQLNKKRLMNNG